MRASTPGWVPGRLVHRLGAAGGGTEEDGEESGGAESAGLDGAVHGSGFLSRFREGSLGGDRTDAGTAPSDTSSHGGIVGCRADPAMSLWFDVNVSPGLGR